MKQYKTVGELAQVLKEDLEAQVVTTDPYRRGDIAREWSLLLHPKWRLKRWFHSAYIRIFDRILLAGETPTASRVYYDEALRGNKQEKLGEDARPPKS